MVTTHPYTLDELLAMGPEVPFEVIGGEPHEVSPTWMEPSVIAFQIGAALLAFAKAHRLGFVTGADGGYILSRDPLVMVAPDVGFVRRDRLPPNFRLRGFCPVPPDLAVEVESNSDRPREVQDKVAQYLAAGVPLVWQVRPRGRLVLVHRPGAPRPEVIAEDGILDCGDVLPGFRLPVTDIFA